MPRSVYPTDGNDEITLLGNADAALRRAKAEARGSFRYFDANMDARQRERVALQRDLRSVLKEGALVVYYRPLAQISGDTFGFEALVRWRHPDAGLAFAGNIHSSGRRMWSDLRHRELGVAGGVPRSRILEVSPSDRGQYIPTSVPISFSLPGLVALVLAETGLEPERLEPEITEGVVISDPIGALATLRQVGHRNSGGRQRADLLLATRRRLRP